MKLFVALSVLWVAACERKAPVDKAPPAPPPSPPVMTPPEPPKPGTFELEVSGHVSMSKKGIGTMCGFGRSVTSVESEPFGATPKWRFWVGKNFDDPKVASAVFTVGEAEYEWGGDQAQLLVDDGPTPIAFERDMKNKKGDTIRVRAHLACPTFPTAPLPKAVLTLLAKHDRGVVRAYSTYDYGRAEYPAAGSVTIPEQKARTVLPTLREALPKGYIAFLGTSHFLGEEQFPDGHVELVVAPGATQFDIIRTARTDAVNYGIETEAIVRQLERWDAEVGIDITLANADTVVFSLRTLPKDVEAFAKDVYAFCPDIVDQGVGSLDALVKEIRAHQHLLLWWD
jgi:hypothetical protein